MENVDFPIPVPAGRLRRQIAFVLEADKQKGVLRQSYLTSEARRENSGEHSWHTAGVSRDADGLTLGLTRKTVL
jgi:hypothetical protein